jgi:hypothetical protein
VGRESLSGIEPERAGHAARSRRPVRGAASGVGLRECGQRGWGASRSNGAEPERAGRAARSRRRARGAASKRGPRARCPDASLSSTFCCCRVQTQEAITNSGCLDLQTSVTPYAPTTQL